MKILLALFFVMLFCSCGMSRYSEYHFVKAGSDEVRGGVKSVMRSEDPPAYQYSLSKHELGAEWKIIKAFKDERQESCPTYLMNTANKRPVLRKGEIKRWIHTFGRGHTDKFYATLFYVCCLVFIALLVLLIARVLPATAVTIGISILLGAAILTVLVLAILLIIAFWPSR
jgi:hypothetical protein